MCEDVLECGELLKVKERLFPPLQPQQQEEDDDEDDDAGESAR